MLTEGSLGINGDYEVDKTYGISPRGILRG